MGATEWPITWCQKRVWPAIDTSIAIVLDKAPFASTGRDLLPFASLLSTARGIEVHAIVSEGVSTGVSVRIVGVLKGVILEVWPGNSQYKPPRVEILGEETIALILTVLDLGPRIGTDCTSQGNGQE